MTIAVILMGLSVMVSMTGWLTDQVIGKREGTWLKESYILNLNPNDIPDTHKKFFK